jgi:hypothetical protein
LAALGAVVGCAAPTDDATGASSDAVTTSTNASRLVDVPFYFSVPRRS